MLSTIDFSNVVLTAPSSWQMPASKAKTTANETKQKPQAKPKASISFSKKSSKNENSYSIFNSYIDQLSSGKITDQKLKNGLEKYFKNDVNQCLKAVQDKLELIKSQEANKNALLVFAENSKGANSFYYPNVVLSNWQYNFTLLNETPESKNFILHNIQRLNFSEHLYISQSRLFFDIDLDHKGPDAYEDKLNDLVKLFSLIKYLCDEYSLNAHGSCEYKDEFVSEWFKHEEFKSLPFVLWFKTDNPNAKPLSGHIYLDGYTDRESIMNYMKYLKCKFQIKTNVLDPSVYKTTKQAFRMAYSAKVEKGKEPRYPSNDLIQYVIQNPSIIDNWRMAPRPSDKKIEIDPLLLLEFENSIENSKSTQNSGKTKTPKASFIASEDSSIFKYLCEKDVLYDIAKHVFNDKIDHFSLAKMFCPYLSMPLTVEEFQQEFMNIELVENEEFTKEINTAFLSNALSTLNYVQNYKNISPLYTLKKYAYQHLQNLKEEVKQEKKNLSEVQPEIDKHASILEGIDYYITKYSKISFASHHDSFYDIVSTRKGSKEQKILYNIYGLVDGRYIEPFTSTTFKNITELKNYYRFNSDTAEYLKNTITYYKSQTEYELYVTQYEYDKLSSDQREKLNNDVKELIKILETSFYNADDMKYYLGFLAAKLRNKESLNKGIINQPRTNEGSGKDSLKTFITDLLDSYLNIMSPNVENINKPLNGAYFKSDLIVFQEIPRNVKDIENFINRLKENSCVKKLTIEEKGLNAVKQVNTTDFIINTNHTMEKLFYNKNDCEALLKRFKVLERKTIDMSDPHVNEILDQFGHLNNTKNNELVHAHAFYMYLMGDEGKSLFNYYSTHKNITNEIEKLYSTSSIDSNNTDTIITNYTKEQFIDDFKKRFTNKNRVNIKQLLTELMTQVKEYKDIKKPDTIKHKLLTTRMLTYDEKNKKYTITDDQIAMFYNTYYSYFDSSEVSENPFNTMNTMNTLQPTILSEISI